MPEPPFFNIKLESLERNHTNISANIIVNTNLLEYKRNKYAPVRSLAEILRLHSYLQTVYPEYILPIPPYKSSKMDILARGIEKLFTRIASKTRLRTSDGVRQFIESEFAFVQTMPLRRQSKSLLASVIPGSSSKDVDPYFENAKFDEDSGFQLMQSWMRSADKLAKAYKDHSKSSYDLSSRLSNVEFNAAFVNQCCKRFAKSLQSVDDINSLQATYIGISFAESCHAHMCNCESAGISLSFRSEALSSYESACKITTKKVQAIERLKNGGNLRQEKVDSALEELSEAKKNEAESKEILKRMTDVLRQEYTRHDDTMHLDVVRDLSIFAEQQQNFAEREIRVLDSFLEQYSQSSTTPSS
ncbi:Vacuolar protein sorting-associated protein 17 [Nowakowskiella sp. JEL0078]|nr:Vacuolar protein sorting-associated protein 17 [Nowakowskiella sp. JEL0078]